MPAKSEKQRKAACAALYSKDPKGAAKSMKKMGKKKLKDFCKSKVEESKNMLDKNILTEAQKKELSKIIDDLVDERVQERQSQFVKKYTKFIVESATSKVVEKMRGGLMLKVEEKIDDVKNKADKVCRSVLAESASRVANIKKQHTKLVEEFKSSAPKMIRDLAEKKAQELAEESKGALEENSRLTEAFKNFTAGLAKAGYVINEDIDNVIEKERTEKRMLRTKLIESRRNNKLAQLTEGMLPGQKKKVIELLEDCVTEKQVEDRFLTVKAKVLAEDRHVETENISDLKRKQSQLEEEQSEDMLFESLIGISKEFIEKNI
jgi:hypothetical protein